MVAIVGDTMKVIIDLFCGLGGATSAFANKDWKVIRIDNNRELLEEVKGMWLLDMNDPQNVRSIIFNHLYELGVTRMVIWASPPCLNFSDADPDRDSKDHDLTLLKNTMWLIEALSEDFNVTEYIIENVRGAIRSFTPLLGDYRQNISCFFLWGRFAPIACID